jgi:hypothetical protein
MDRTPNLATSSQISNQFLLKLVTLKYINPNDNISLKSKEKLKKDRSKDAGRLELRNWKWEIKHRQLLTLGLDQITKVIYCLDGQGPLVRVIYSGLIHVED